MVRQFPPPGVKAVPSYGWPPYKGGVAHAGGACVWQPQNCTIRGRSPRRCGRGYSWKSALDVGWHGFPESSAVKRRRAPPPRAPASPGASARRTGGGDGGGSDPPFLTAAAAPASVHRRTRWRTVNTPLRGVAPSTVIPAGRLSSRPGSRLEEQQTTDGPQAEKGKPGECTQPDISDPQHGQLATLLDGPGLSVDPRLTCPPRS